MNGLKISDSTQVKTASSGKQQRERNRSGESSKSNKSSSSSSDEGNGQQTSPSLGPLLDLSLSKYIVLEWAENGDLFDFTLAIQEPMGEDLSRYYFSQLLSAVEYLHLD